MQRMYTQDVERLRSQHGTVIELQAGNRRVAVVPGQLGAVADWTNDGDHGLSLAYVSQQSDILGGEHLWLGPEGGSCSVFFAPGQEQNRSNWRPPFTPAAMKFTTSRGKLITMSSEMTVTSCRGVPFECGITRAVEILDPPQAGRDFGLKSLRADVGAVAWQITNTLENRDQRAWSLETGGLICLWDLVQLPQSGRCVSIAPFRDGPENELGPLPTRDYFDPLSDEEAVIVSEKNCMVLRNRGGRRGKRGVSGRRSRGVMGSYDALAGVLTLIRVTEETAGGEPSWLNNHWGSGEAFGGDALQFYTDPNPTGATGLFELEGFGQAALLAHGEKISLNLELLQVLGSQQELSDCAGQVFGLALKEIPFCQSRRGN
jgi:hypothetical protein